MLGLETYGDGSTADELLESGQKLRRSDRPKVRIQRTRKWAEKSVWSEVCALDLGLIAETSRFTREECEKKEEKKIYKRQNNMVKEAFSRNGKIRKEPKFEGPAVLEPQEFMKDTILNEHLYARANSLDNLDESRTIFEAERKKVKKLIRASRKESIVYNPFNVFHNRKNFGLYKKKCNTGEPTPMRRCKNSFSQKRQKLKVLEARDKKKKNRKFVRENHLDGRKEICDSRRKTLNTKKNKRGRKRAARSKSFEKLEKKEYEESDMDESLLVNPSTDLPQSLLETIDNDFALCNPEFDVSRALNFESDTHFSSSFESVQRDLWKKEEAAGTFEGNARNDFIEEKGKSSAASSDNNTSTNDKIEESGAQQTRAQRRLRSADQAAIDRNNKKASLRLNQQKCKEEARPLRRRRSAGEASGKEEKSGDDKASVKRRRSANDAASSHKTGKIEAKQNLDKYSTKDGRVTRLSTRNCTALEKTESRETGTVVWGNCMGWWPGLIVGSEDVGMLKEAGKAWVCWIGEYRISHLREKTQIQPFSTCLRERMIETLKSKSPKDPSYKACIETLEMLNINLLDFGPINEPGHVWAEKHLTSLENIDRLILRPYPPEVQVRLNQLKRSNSKVTAKYLLQQKMSAEKASMKSCNSVRSTTTKNTFVPIPGHLPLIKQKPGVIAWAKIMGQVWWPAVIVDYRDLSIQEPSFGCQWIVWYGDYTMSQVNHRFFLSFDNGMSLMKEYVRNCKRECYRRGVIDAAKDYCSRHGYKTEGWQMEQVFHWFETGNGETTGNENFSVKNLLPGIPGNSNINEKYPSRVLQVLRKHKGNCTVAAAREQMIRESASLRLVETCQMKIEDLCLMCLEECSRGSESTEHPYFFGKLCEECSEKYKPTIFAYGEDGKCFFCTICAGSDTVVMCDAEDCPRVYCTACIKYLVAPKFYNEILLQDPWMCFVCDPSEDSTRDGSLKPRCDWKDHVSHLFRANRESVPEKLELYKNGKRKLRVLSLFDGISAGLVVLKKLGIQIELYYASEIDPDAEMVSSAHHGQEIIRLGDVRSIDEDKIREIIPIDLLLGGSPCNDLSLVNPLRLGLHDPNGTGVLFFEYSRIKNFLEAHNGQHFFWLFENVASMPSKYRNDISKHLGREPELIDSANYSPQHRPRLYWSNLPIVSFPLSTQDLQDVLNPNCNRQALVKKIRTVTTRVNSLKQGRDALKPILMNETNDTLWITELEEIFGFPKHYTDVKNLCATKRQKLIAMSWSVQTIVEIMRPLCNFFYTHNDELVG
ncbi:uncharacterized protein [Venturia canescens]|uniref:uncharacterized protein isoform X2 n=1 Tax=Venturia canescens TaxID=32260 RepID=UPI001C9C0C5E|nr:uncharacterized protein LOC122413504 isoform X2 [Venturia canescens]